MLNKFKAIFPITLVHYLQNVHSRTSAACVNPKRFLATVGVLHLQLLRAESPLWQ